MAAKELYGSRHSADIPVARSTGLSKPKLPVASDHVPSLDQSSVLDHRDAPMESAGRTDVCRNRQDLVARFKTIGIRRFNDEVLFIVNDRPIGGHVQKFETS